MWKKLDYLPHTKNKLHWLNDLNVQQCFYDIEIRKDLFEDIKIRNHKRNVKI